MRITFLPHALEHMRARGISEEEARLVLEDPDREGEANFGRLYARKEIGHRRIRVVYNRGPDETVAVSAMLRRREGGRS
jgi:hypothetical protein